MGFTTGIRDKVAPIIRRVLPRITQGLKLSKLRLKIKENNNTHNVMMLNGEQQKLVASSFGGILLPTPTLEVLNAAGPHLAQPSDEIRVFSTIIRRNGPSNTPAATEGGADAPAKASNNNNNQQQNALLNSNFDFPLAKRIDSGAAYFRKRASNGY